MNLCSKHTEANKHSRAVGCTFYSNSPISDSLEHSVGCLRRQLILLLQTLFLYSELTNRIHSPCLQDFLLELLTPQFLKAYYPHGLCQSWMKIQLIFCSFTLIPKKQAIMFKFGCVWKLNSGRGRTGQEDRDQFLLHTHAVIYNLCWFLHQSYFTADRHCTALTMI